MHAGPKIEVREATSADNADLVALSVASPMEGDVVLAVDRAPDFFALNRLEGPSWRVGVVDGPQHRPVGCIAVAERDLYRNGVASPAVYVSDLKVHPDHRGSGMADALTAWARDAAVAVGGLDTLVFFTVLAGNQSMKVRMAGPRGLPTTLNVATIRTHTIPLLHPRRQRQSGLTIATASAADLDEMVDLWDRWAPSRHFGSQQAPFRQPALLNEASNLEVTSFRIARDTDGRLLGYLGAWDQTRFKRLRVEGYSRRLGAVRSVFNAVTPLVGATPLPKPGEALRNLTVFGVCVDSDDPAVLRALVIDTYNRSLRQGFSFLNIGLDRKDPLSAVLAGLWAQPTDVWLATATLPGRASVALDPRPCFHEIALV